MLDEMVVPAYMWVPPSVGTFGYEAIDLCKEAGLEFDAEQELVINGFMSHDNGGDWVAQEVCIIQPRQNGKTNRILIPIALWQLYLGPPDVTIWTAHRFKTSSQSFVDIKKIIDGCYELRRYVKKISESHGEESIQLINGAELPFLARSKSGGRGLGGPRPILDEAFAVQSGQIGALLPTILARPNVQVMYASSGGLEDSEHLRNIRDRGRAGSIDPEKGDSSLAYFEWCAPGSWEEPGCELGKTCDHDKRRKGCALDNPENIKKANPAYIRRIRPTSIGTLRKSMTPLEFGREILTWWEESTNGESIPISEEAWNLCMDVDSQVVGPISIAFDVSPDMNSASIGICGYRLDGIMHGELIRYATGIDWVIEELVRLKNKHRMMRIDVTPKKDGKVSKEINLKPTIVFDSSSPANALISELNKRKVFPVPMSSSNLGSAFGGLQDAVKRGPEAWRHLGQEQVSLAMMGAVKRPIGDGGWAVARNKSAQVSVDVSSFSVIAMARWGATVSVAPSVGPNIYVL